MKEVVLKSKFYPHNRIELTILDDMVTGMVANNYYIPAAPSVTGCIVFYDINYLIENFLWPNCSKVARIESFLKGHNPELAKKIEHYAA